MAVRPLTGRHLVKIMMAHLLPRDADGRLFRRNKWPVLMPIYDGRQCPYCAAIVVGPHGQRWHQQWHEEEYGEGDTVQDEARSAPRAVEEAPDAGGYVIGAGPLPEEIVRSDEEEREAQRR